VVNGRIFISNNASSLSDNRISSGAKLHSASASAGASVILVVLSSDFTFMLGSYDSLKALALLEPWWQLWTCVHQNDWSIKELSYCAT